MHQGSCTVVFLAKNSTSEQYFVAPLVSNDIQLSNLENLQTITSEADFNFIHKFMLLAKSNIGQMARIM